MLDRGAGCDSKHLDTEIALLRVPGRIKLIGRIDDARELLWASDVFAMPSVKEGLGVAALEAMASGLPVIASEVGGLREVVEDDRTGILVPPANPAAIGSAIARLADGPGLRAEMGAAARARALENYSMAETAALTLEIYRACLRKTREGRGGADEKHDRIRPGDRRA